MPRSSSGITEIPNINIGQVYDQRYIDSDLHYERLEALAEFFGRNMPVHFHDRFFQIHLVETGVVRVNLDETNYTAKGPMFFFTPPTVPHSFTTERASAGHVVTVRQELVWSLLGTSGSRLMADEALVNQPLCIELGSANSASAKRLLQLMNMLAEEQGSDAPAHAEALSSLMRLILIDIDRLADRQLPRRKNRKEDVRIFNRFNQLIEQHYKEHRALSFYGAEIGVTEARLNEICRRLAGIPSKRLIADRLIQEARRQLRFSSSPITEIGYALGYKDPAYFARFFRRNVGMTASEFRDKKQ